MACSALARQALRDGDGAGARTLLQPIAYAPHYRIDKDDPLTAIKLIDAGKLAEARAALDSKADKS